MEYICKDCNKKYSSYQSLWNHNKRYHSSIILNVLKPPQNINNDNNKLYCQYCNKESSRVDNLKRHEKNCKEQKTIKKELAELKEEIKQLKTSSKKIVKNYNNTFINGDNISNSNNNNIKNKITINKIGTENVLELNDQEVTEIFNKELESIILFIEYLNFNQRLQNNHSYCTTSLESPYLSIFNADSKKIEKDRKKYFFDSIMSKAITQQEELYNHHKSKFNRARRTQIEDNIENLKNIKNYGFNNTIVKEIIKKINLLSYNKRDLIQNTWNNMNETDDIEEEAKYFAELMKDENKESSDDESSSSYEYKGIIPIKKIEKK